MHLQRLAFLAVITALVLTTTSTQAEDQDAGTMRPYELRVVDGEGKPMAGVSARLSRYRVVNFHPVSRASNASLFGAPDRSANGALVKEVQLRSDAKGMLRFEVGVDERASLVVMPAVGLVPGVWHVMPQHPGTAPKELTILPGRVLRGRVTIGGKGVQAYLNALVRPSVNSWASTGYGVTTWMPTNHPTGPDGAFELTVPKGGRVVMGAYAPGRYARYGLKVEPEQESDVALELATLDGARITGTVRTNDGRPVAGAAVWVGVDNDPVARHWGTTGRLHTQLGMTRTDDRGRYVISSMQAGYVKSVHADAEEVFHVTLGRQLALPLAKGESLEINLRTSRPVIVEGQVEDQDDRPVPRARIDVLSHSTARMPSPFPGQPAAQVFTDDEGRYRIRVPPGRPCTVRASAAGYTVMQGPGRVSRRRTGHGVPIDVPASGTVRAPLIRLQRGVPIEGWVITPSGEPMPFVTVNATVSGVLPVPEGISRTSNRSGNGSAVTDAAGRFRIPGMPAYTRVRLTTTGAPPGGNTVTVEVHDKPPAPARLYHRPMTRISGRVLRHDGTPVPHGQVLCTPRVGTTAWTDSAGRFTIARVTPGKVVVSVARAVNPESRRELEVDGETPIDDVELKIGGDATLSGIVRYTDGAPAPETWVNVFHARIGRNAGANVLTDAKGRFELIQMPIGTYTVSSGGAQAMVDVGGAGAKVWLELKRTEPWHIEGRALDLNGEPIPRATLTVRAANGAMQVVPVVAGRFTATQQAAGAVSLVVHRATDAAGRPLPGIPGALEGYKRGDPPPTLELRVGQSLRGVVEDGQGKPIAGATVTVSLSQRPWWDQTHIPSTTTDAHGHFHFPSVTEGKGTITVVHPEQIVAKVTRDFESTGPLMKLVAVRARELVCQTVDDNGQPIPRVTVRVYVDGADRKRGTRPPTVRGVTDENGIFTARGLHPDEVYTVSVDRAQRDDQRFLEAQRRVDPWPTHTVAIRMRALAVVEGRVALPEGSESKGFRVVLEAWYLDERLPSRGVNIKEGETAFKITDVVPGRYRVVVTSNGDFKRSDTTLVTAPAKLVRVPLERAYPLRGRVISDVKRRTRVYFYPSNRKRGAGNPPYATVRSNGQFQINFDENVRGTLVVRERDGRGAILPDVHPDEGPFSLELAPLWSLRGIVENFPSDKLTRGLSITITCGQWWHRATIQDGTFAFDRIPPARCKLEIEYADRLKGKIELPEYVEPGQASIVLKYVAPRGAADDRR